MKKLHWKKIAVAGFWYWVITTLVQQLELAWTMGYYTDPVRRQVWSRVMMPEAGGPPPVGFFVVSAMFTFVTGMTVAAVFEFIKPQLGKTYWGKVVGFTDIMVGLSIVFALFPIYLLLNVPLGLLGWWLVANWVSMFAASAVFAKTL